MGPSSKLRGKFLELFPHSKAQPNVWHASTIFWVNLPVCLPCSQLFAGSSLNLVKDLNIASSKLDQSFMLFFWITVVASRNSQTAESC